MNSVIDYVQASNVKRLQILRGIAILCEFGALWLAFSWFGVELPVGNISLIIVLHSLFFVFAWYRNQSREQLLPIEFALLLTVDTLVLAAILYFSGGYTNPFVSLFLLPLVIAASILSPRYAGLMAILTITCYSLLVFFYVPLPHKHLEVLSEEGGFGLHVIGMWFSFLLSVGLVIFFVVRMSGSLRERDHALAKSRVKALQDEHLVALGTLATGAAHELGTPLATMAVLVNELKYDHSEDNDLLDKVGVLRAQLDRCKVILSDITASAGHVRGEGGGPRAVDVYIRDVLAQWQLLRSDAHLDLSVEVPANSNHEILTDKTLTQAIINILNNAADASMYAIAVRAYVTGHHFIVDVYDQGDGLNKEQLTAVGTPFYTTKADGHGLGLYLARSVVERYRGTLSIENRNDTNGVHVNLTLPLTVLGV